MNKPVEQFHVFDLESGEFSKSVTNTWMEGSGKGLAMLPEFIRASSTPGEFVKHDLYRAHFRSQILQLFATGDDVFRKGDAHGWIKPDPEYLPYELRNLTSKIGKFNESKFAHDEGLYADAKKFGVLPEDEHIEEFFQALERDIARDGSTTLGGHNIFKYDLWKLEHALYQHESLKHRRGWIAKMYQTGKLKLRDSDVELLQAGLDYAKTDPDFARNHFKSATTLEEAQFVPGHKLTNVGKALDYVVPSHNAFYDTGTTVQLFQHADSGAIHSPEFLKRVFAQQSAPARASIETSTSKTAYVLDIDGTALSDRGAPVFRGPKDAAAFDIWANKGNAKRLEPTYNLYRQALEDGHQVHFITARSPETAQATIQNLANEGYDRFHGIEFKPNGMNSLAFKQAARGRLEAQGLDILQNIGDSATDFIGGGPALRAAGKSELTSVSAFARTFAVKEQKMLKRFGAIALGAAVLGTIFANSTRKDRQTQITGLADGNMAADLRHRLTEFGSGYVGLPQVILRPGDSPFNRKRSSTRHLRSLLSDTKPETALWSSSYKPETKSIGWVNFAPQSWLNDYAKGVEATVFMPSSDSRVLSIHSGKDVAAMLAEYGTGDGDYTDWGKVRKDYDAVHFSEEVFRERNRGKVDSVVGLWGTESTAWLRDTIEDVRTLPGLHLPDLQTQGGLASIHNASRELVEGALRKVHATQIQGLAHGGTAEKLRHLLTAFGSGWQGIDASPQLESEQAYSPFLRTVGIGVVGSAAWMAHKHYLATDPTYAARAYRWAKTFEEGSPWRIGRTFGLSERLAANLPQELTFTADMLTQDDGSLNVFGRTFQQQFGETLDVQREVTDANPLIFRRGDAGRAHMDLVSHDGRGISTMFTPRSVEKDGGGRLFGAATRIDQPLYDLHVPRSHAPTPVGQAWGNFQNHRSSQRVINPLKGGAEFEGNFFGPFHTKIAAATDEPLDALRAGIRNLGNRANVELFNVMESPQRLFSEIGGGLKRGGYNKLFHLPFVGSGGMLNQMMTKRVLPVIAGVTALGYLDYLTGHKVRDTIIDLPLKASVLHADLTDMLPGGRSVTDFYENTAPGSQYGPLALPLSFAFAGGAWHYQQVVRGKFATKTARAASARLFPEVKVLKRWASKTGNSLFSVAGGKALWSHLGAPGKMGLIGLAAMLPAVPGMLGSRKTGQEQRDIYSGQDPVAIRSGRWWELGSTPYEGARIKEYRPHKSILWKTNAETKALWGSEKEAWKHNPILHPLRWLRDPYALEKQNYEHRPYPVSSPAFSDVPLIGPILAATIGRVVKPTVRMHEAEWSGENYSLYSTRLEPKGPEAIAAPKLKDENSLGQVFQKEAGILAEYTGALGWAASSVYNAIYPDYDKGRQAFYQGSRQMENFSRRYYENEFGAGLFLAPSIKEHFGYTEPFRRFVQREDFTPQANEVPNHLANWLPGDDYFVNLKVGDPYVKIDDGYARLPGAGYAAMHPELEGVDPNDYPDINKLSILADVAPYSREYNTFRQIVGGQASQNTELDIEYQKILGRVQEMKNSVVRMGGRKFTAPTDEIAGTVEEVSTSGVALKEYPGRRFQFSSVGMGAADMSAAVLGEQNNLSRGEVAREVEQRRGKLNEFLTESLLGKSVRLTVPEGAAKLSEVTRAVIKSGGTNINRELIDRGYGRYREDLGGAESSAMHSVIGRTAGAIAEGLAFQGDSSALNPMRYVPAPGHTKLWQERTPVEQYLNQEVYGTRMRRWHRPVHDFLAPYFRGTERRLTGQTIIPEDVEYRRDLNTMADMLQFVRGQVKGYTSQSKRTSIGANQFSSPTFIASTLPDREAHYFRALLQETDVEKRADILEVASPEMSRALSSQWVAQETRIAVAEGKSPGEIGENGRLYTRAGVEEFKKSDTKLGYGDWLRSKEIGDFFSRSGLTLPDEESAAWDESLDYSDVQLKIVQNEGYDAHDFNLFDDRSAVLWRKPYVDGAVRELTSGEQRSPEQLRRSVEQMMLNAKNRDPDVRAVVQPSHQGHANVRLDVEIDEQEAMLKDMRRNPEKYDTES